MALTLIILIFTALLLYFLSLQKRSLIFYFPVIIVYLEVVRAIVRPVFGALDGFNGIILVTYIYFIILTRLSLDKYKKMYSILYVFAAMFVFFFVNAYSGSGIVAAVSNVGRFLFIPGIFFIGYAVFNSNYKISALNRYTYYACIIMIVTTIIFTISGHGKERGIISGYMQGEIYFFPLFITLGILMLLLNKREDVVNIPNNKLLLVLTLSLLITAVSMSRTAWLILLVLAAIIPIKFFDIKIIRQITIGLLFVIVSLAAFLYGSGLYLDRAYKFSSDYELQEENRVLETVYINEFYLTTTKQKWLGTGDGFISSITFPDGRERVIHSTYNRIFHGYGILGVMIYLLFNLLILYKLITAKTYNSDQEIFKIVGYALIIGFILTSFSGITYPLAYSTLNFLYIGAILGYLHNYDEKISTCLSNKLITSRAK